ncbi:hypothetical protein ACHAXT_011033 [Thalassiosira profunda]
MYIIDMNMDNKPNQPTKLVDVRDAGAVALYRLKLTLLQLNTLIEKGPHDGLARRLGLDHLIGKNNDTIGNAFRVPGPFGRLFPDLVRETYDESFILRVPERVRHLIPDLEERVQRFHAERLEQERIAMAVDDNTNGQEALHPGINAAAPPQDPSSMAAATGGGGGAVNDYHSFPSGAVASNLDQGGNGNTYPVQQQNQQYSHPQPAQPGSSFNAQASAAAAAARQGGASNSHSQSNPVTQGHNGGNIAQPQTQTFAADAPATFHSYMQGNSNAMSNGGGGAGASFSMPGGAPATFPGQQYPAQYQYQQPPPQQQQQQQQQNMANLFNPNSGGIGLQDNGATNTRDRFARSYRSPQNHTHPTHTPIGGQGLNLEGVFRGGGGSETLHYSAQNDTSTPVGSASASSARRKVKAKRPSAPLAGNAAKKSPVPRASLARGNLGRSRSLDDEEEELTPTQNLVARFHSIKADTVIDHDMVLSLKGGDLSAVDKGLLKEELACTRPSVLSKHVTGRTGLELSKAADKVIQAKSENDEDYEDGLKLTSMRQAREVLDSGKSEDNVAKATVLNKRAVLRSRVLQEQIREKKDEFARVQAELTELQGMEHEMQDFVDKTGVVKMWAKMQEPGARTLMSLAEDTKVIGEPLDSDRWKGYSDELRSNFELPSLA